MRTKQSNITDYPKEPCQIDNCKHDWEIYFKGYKLCRYHTEQMRKLGGFLGVKHG